AATTAATSATGGTTTTGTAACALSASPGTRALRAGLLLRRRVLLDLLNLLLDWHVRIESAAATATAAARRRNAGCPTGTPIEPAEAAFLRLAVHDVRIDWI